MIRPALILPVLILLVGCQTRPTDTFCKTHTVDQFRLSTLTIDTMTAQEKRNALRTLEEGSRLCGWTK